MFLNFSTLVGLDKIWCGNHQIPASLLLKTSEKKSVSRLASFRLGLAFFLFAEIFGYFFITIGLFPTRPIWVFLFGICLKIFGEIGSSYFQNRSGSFLSLELQNYLENLNSHALEIKSLLAEKGCTESEINSLSILPKEVYQSELNGYQRLRMLNIGTPLFCGLGLLINGDYITSLIVMILGVLAYPISERFFKEHTFRRESELRLGIAAQVKPYVEKIYQEHVWMTTKVNFLGQLPLLLFAFRFLWNSTAGLLSSFFALTQGLMGLTGSLAFQKGRASAIKTTETTTHLLNVFSSSYLIATPQRWKEHTSQAARLPISEQKNRGGILLKDFSFSFLADKHQDFVLNTFIPAGSICLLRAPSGKGKTLLLAALNHLVEHKGDLFFMSKSQSVNVHELSREEFNKKLFYLREENIDKSARIVDLFKASSSVHMSSFITDAKRQFDSILVELAWKASDNLIEQEVSNIEQDKPSVFPKHMLNFLKDLRNQQIEKIDIILKKAEGNLLSERIHAERNFSTLSAGEKRRLVPVIALENCSVIPEISFVIFDEPLTHLDHANVQHQLNIISKIQNLSAPAILIISHQSIDEMKNQLQDIAEISF